MSRSVLQENNAGILIVGAGPTGLTLANTLAAYGVPFTLIDRKSGPSHDSKALALNLASQHVLESLGLEKELGTSNGRLHRVTVHWEGSRLTAVDLRRLDFDRHEMIVQPQSDTECELIASLRARGHEVTWNTRLLDITEHDQNICALIEHADGSCSTQTFEYAVGCDGKGSLVASRIGVEFTGKDYPAHFVLGDFPLHWKGSRGEGHYYVHDDGFFIILPVGETHWRVVVKHDGLPPEKRAVSARDVTDYVEAHLGKDVFSGPPVWLSRAAFYMRIADRMRSKRLFIAGDAAHLFSPIGGTGMNTGMQDALNLGWKLALNYQGRAKESLLDSFEIERLEVIRATGAAADRSTRLIARLDDDPAAVMPLLPNMRNRKMLRLVLPVLHSGLGVACPQAFSGRSDDAVAGSRRAGELCLALREFLDALPVTSAGQNPREGLPKLLIVARPVGESDVAQLGRLVDALDAHAGLADVLALCENQNALTNKKTADNVVTISPSPAILRRCGVGPGGLLLVHPDALIGFSGSLQQAEGLLHTLDTHFKQCVSTEFRTKTYAA